MNSVATKEHVQVDTSKKEQFQPPYNVVLLDDDDHTYEYVIDMIRKLFGFPYEEAYAVAEELDTSGRVILLTTTLEHAELKQSQVHSFGRDFRLERSQGCMSCILEPDN